MPSFRKKPKVKKPPEAEKPKDQAQDLVAAKTALRTPRHNSREDGWIHSVNTRDAYSAVINRACQWMQARGHADGCRSMTVEQAHTYLKYRAARLCQKSLNGERVALEKVLPQFDGIRLDRFEAAKGPTRLSTGPQGLHPGPTPQGDRQADCPLRLGHSNRGCNRDPSERDIHSAAGPRTKALKAPEMVPAHVSGTAPRRALDREGKRRSYLPHMDAATPS